MSSGVVGGVGGGAVLGLRSVDLQENDVLSEFSIS